MQSQALTGNQFEIIDFLMEFLLSENTRQHLQDLQVLGLLNVSGENNERSHLYASSA
jgi:hypothetical protein